MKRALVWFKTDLRLEDNETLVQAIAQYDEIIPVYCFDDAHFTTTAFGFKKTGSFRAQFLLASLKDLDCNLRTLGSGLMIAKGKPEIAIPQIVKNNNIQKVFCMEEFAFEELQTLNKVKHQLLKINCNIETYNTSTLYHLSDLPFEAKAMPDVFTNFRIKVEKEGTVRKALDKPKAIPSPSIAPLVLPSLQELGMAQVTIDARAVLHFKGGESAAWERLTHYFFNTQQLSTYADTRNGLIGDAYSSKFSAWLALGCISAKSIYAQVKIYEHTIIANKSTYWLIFELLWRDYFKWMMMKYGFLFFKKQGIKINLPNLNQHNTQLFEKWQLGKTNCNFIDANMRELQLTGFMSNRGRQNVASYLYHDLQLDWRFGAAYFEQQLIDYDACSNWCNWAYLAGVGNDARITRKFNIDKQAKDYDKEEIFRNLWLNKN
jgi:deoxyribodipyrimidine photo-lyase